MTIKKGSILFPRKIHGNKEGKTVVREFFTGTGKRRFKRSPTANPFVKLAPIRRGRKLASSDPNTQASATDLLFG